MGNNPRDQRLGTPLLKTIEFLASPSPGQSQLLVETSHVTLFVGPNNSGKSLALREILELCSGPGSRKRKRVVGRIEMSWPDTWNEILEIIRPLIQNPDSVSAESRVDANIFLSRSALVAEGQSGGANMSRSSLEAYLRDRDFEGIRASLADLLVTLLDVRTRLSLVTPQDSGDLHKPGSNHLQLLFQDDVARHKLQEITYELFQRHLIIDPTGMNTLRVRMSDRPIEDHSVEKKLTSDALSFQAGTPLIESLGDGVQSTVGLLIGIFALHSKMYLIDEPENLLHPPLARRLALALCRNAVSLQLSMVIATHSAEFVIGCIESGIEVSIVRLTYQNDRATARVLLPRELINLSHDPLLRSSSPLRALFHSAVIITESEIDRAFYDEVNRRLLRQGRGLNDALFIHAQNKSTVHRFIAPLKKIGVPAVAVVDLDMIKVESEWRALVTACNVAATELSLLEQERQWLLSAFQSLPQRKGQKERMKSEGIAALSEPNGDRARKFLTGLGAFGIFLVPVGEVESWLKHLSIRKKGSDWLTQLFGRLGQSESESSYVHPSSGDVWGFMDDVARWVNNPDRRGV